MNITDTLKKMACDSITLQIKGKAPERVGCTRFGGAPDVPHGFSWPLYETDTYDDDEIKPRPLAFLAQFDCASLPCTEGENQLPKTGVLSFFYELGSMKWGFDPKDAGCAKVYWFEDKASLSPMDFPQELPDEYRLPAINIESHRETSYPEYCDMPFDTDEDFFDVYESALSSLGFERPMESSKLLGWADIIQDTMTYQCELASKGYYLGGSYEDIPQKVIEEAHKGSPENWILLFQLDTVEQDDFQLMFGDCGRIYFYIRKDDLKCCRFDRIWLIMQCC